MAATIYAMNIYALKGPSSDDYDTEAELQEVQRFLADSIKSGVSRFGWSYVDTADLRKLQDKGWQEMGKEEQNCWAKAAFLLDVEKGDWVVHINLPCWGECLAGKVTETYSFEENGNDFDDYRHLLKLDQNSIVEFDRNDDRVHPVIGSRLKLQGGHWTIRFPEEFLQTIANLKDKHFAKKESESAGAFHLKKDLSPLLKDITRQIQKNHPGGKLEPFIAEVLRKVPNIIEVKEHGQQKGWGSDDGADLVATYCSGPSVANLEKQETLVVQVKSYTDQHWETSAVEQIETAIRAFQASAGLIITTAESTANLEKAIETLSNKLSKPPGEGGLNKRVPIGLIAGEDVAKFVLKYGGTFVL
jgi:hypothetical protein